MKYVLTESQYKKLNEAVGVPTNIVDITRQLYDKMMSELKPTTKLKSFIKKPIVLKGNFQNSFCKSRFRRIWRPIKNE